MRRSRVGFHRTKRPRSSDSLRLAAAAETTLRGAKSGRLLLAIASTWARGIWKACASLQGRRLAALFTPSSTLAERPDAVLAAKLNCRTVRTMSSIVSAANVPNHHRYCSIFCNFGTASLARCK
jgi:hypothetical protein